jgi:hypothetical protein
LRREGVLSAMARSTVGIGIIRGVACPGEPYLAPGPEPTVTPYPSTRVEPESCALRLGYIKDLSDGLIQTRRRRPIVAPDNGLPQCGRACSPGACSTLLPGSSATTRRCPRSEGTAERRDANTRFIKAAQESLPAAQDGVGRVSGAEGRGRCGPPPGSGSRRERGTTSERSRERGARTPWKRSRWNRGGAISTQSFSMSSKGSRSRWVAPSRRGWGSW